MGRKRKNIRRNVIGLDLGTYCGFVWLSVSSIGSVKIEKTGTILAKRSKFEGGGMQMIRLTEGLIDLFTQVRLASVKYSNNANDTNIPIVVYELINFHKGVEAAHIYGAVSMKVMEQCELYNIPYTGMNPKTIRKLVVGNGNAKKQKVKKVLEKVFGVKFGSHDISDAVACALAFMIREGWIDEP